MAGVGRGARIALGLPVSAVDPALEARREIERQKAKSRARTADRDRRVANYARTVSSVISGNKAKGVTHPTKKTRPANAGKKAIVGVGKDALAAGKSTTPQMPSNPVTRPAPRPKSSSPRPPATPQRPASTPTRKPSTPAAKPAATAKPAAKKPTSKPPAPKKGTLYAKSSRSDAKLSSYGKRGKEALAKFRKDHPGQSMAVAARNTAYLLSKGSKRYGGS